MQTRFNKLVSQIVGKAFDVCRVDREGVAKTSQLRSGRAGGSGSRVPLRSTLRAASLGIERGLFFVLRFTAEYFCFRDRENAADQAGEPVILNRVLHIAILQTLGLFVSSVAIGVHKLNIGDVSRTPIPHAVDVVVGY